MWYLFTYTCGNVLLQSIFQACTALCANACFFGKATIFMLFALIRTGIEGSRLSNFERKHGRWKFRNAFPAFMCIFSAVLLPTVAAASFQRLSLPRHRMRLPRLSPVHLQWRFQQLLEALDQRSDFDKLLDSIEVSTPSSPVEPHFAHEWESLLAHEAMIRHFNGDFADFSDVDNDDSCLSETASVTSDGSSTDTISTTTSCVLSAPLSIADDFDDILISSKLVRILSMPSQSSPELEEALIHLDKKQVLLCPTSLNAVSDAIPNLRHVLHPTCASNQGEIPQELFAVLLDTGCSVACTAFVEDFCGQLAYGHFGSVKTADGLAEIQGFGMVHWETVDVNGKTILIKVPAYYVPTVDMRLLSPQRLLWISSPSGRGDVSWQCKYHVYVREDFSRCFG